MIDRAKILRRAVSEQLDSTKDTNEVTTNSGIWMVDVMWRYSEEETLYQ